MGAPMDRLYIIITTTTGDNHNVHVHARSP